MNTKKNHHLLGSLIASTAILFSAVSHADDTEIFFGGPILDSTIKPNVLFILDNSGSMNWRLNENSVAGSNEQSRLKVLKQSFSDLITNARNINAGVMVLNPRSEYASTRRAYPITNIDANVAADVSSVASRPEILVSGDDATQNSASSTAETTASILPFGYFSNPASGSQVSTLDDSDAFHIERYSSRDYSCSLYPFGRSKNTACRPYRNQDRKEITFNSDKQIALTLFRGFNIPASASNINATLTITPANTLPYDTDIKISAELSKTAQPLNDNSQINRIFSSEITVNDPSNWTNNAPINIDVSSLINNLKSQAPSSANIESVLLRFYTTNSTDRNICMRVGGNCSASELPKLTITYNGASAVSTTESMALRFQNVGIPQGATITAARIDMVPISSANDPLTVQIKAEASNDAAVFTNSSNLVSRAKSSAVSTWAVPTSADATNPWVLSNPPEYIAGPDVSNLVQEVVNRSGWCGNNSMAFHFAPISGTGSRAVPSIDGAPGLQPTLTVSYTGGTNGCLNPIIETRITQEKNDGWEDNNNGRTVSLGASTLPLDQNFVGARFQDLPIIQGAQVLDAKVIITPSNSQSTPSLDLGIRVEDSSNSAQFTSNGGNLNERSKLTSRTCTINNAGGGWTAGTGYVCSPNNLASDIQSIFAKSGWAAGNALSLFLVPASDSNLDIRSYEGNPAESITLRLKLNSGSLTSVTRTVRSEINAIVQAMYAESGTPVVPTLEEASRYYRGARTGWENPMTHACQPNHLVLLTDGQANTNSDSSVHSRIQSLTGDTCDASVDSGEYCGRELTNHIYQNDLNSTLDGKQNITVHTIGFALDSSSNANDIKTFLRDLASPISADSTTKSTYTAANSSELNDAFNRIIQSVMSIDTTFVSPGATVNQFERTTNKNEVYFALFKPSETNRWVGNLKRYSIDDGSGNTTSLIYDADNVPAIDATTGYFKSSARSFWSSSTDGNNTAAGGAASNLPSANSRKLLTYLGNSPASAVTLNTAQHLINNSNTSFTNGHFNADSDSEREELITWLREAGDRKSMSDPLHSVPQLVTYACSTYTDNTYTSCAAEEQSVIVGTNEGYVQAFDTANGVEQFAYMPESLLSNIKKLKANENTAANQLKPYGMDNTVTLWINDANENGVIYGGKNPSSNPPTLLSGLNTGEFIYAYATMGRGGRELHALDITNRTTPKLMWFIKGGATNGFNKLGQTWSAPIRTKIQVDSTVTDVLIFAGGYDANQDNVSVRTADSVGNALYIVNATTGALIWSASNSTNTTGASLALTNMQYSMPAQPRVFDISGDGLADQILIADMGGQVWRFFINNGNAASSLVTPTDSDGNGTITNTDGIFASAMPNAVDYNNLSPSQKENNLRRFYNTPDAALVKTRDGLSMVVNIGSGYRGHPLSKAAVDRFYSFRTQLVYNPSASNPNNTTALTESNLYDATENLIQEGSDSQKADAATQMSRGRGGWYITMSNLGEKVLSRSVTIEGQVFFTSYEPSANDTSSCKAAAGTGRFYAVNLLDATPLVKNVSGTPVKANRVRSLKTQGIPSDPVVLFRPGDKGIVCVGTECEELPPLTPPGKTFWIDEL